jgi:hypothetical protein
MNGLGLGLSKNSRVTARRPSTAMSKALRAGFQRIIHRRRPCPVGSRPMIARETHVRAACSFGKCPRAFTARRMRALTDSIAFVRGADDLADLRRRSPGTARTRPRRSLTTARLPDIEHPRTTAPAAPPRRFPYLGRNWRGTDRCRPPGSSSPDRRTRHPELETWWAAFIDGGAEYLAASDAEFRALRRLHETPTSDMRRHQAVAEADDAAPVTRCVMR